jgi:hypothetical protein
MTTIILAAVIPLSVNFLLAAAAFRIPAHELAPVGADAVPEFGTEPKASEAQIGAEVINETASETEVKQAA